MKIEDERNFEDESVKLIFSLFFFFPLLFIPFGIGIFKKKCGLRGKFLGLREQLKNSLEISLFC